MVKRASVGTSLIEVMIAVMILAAMGTAIISLTLQVMAVNTSARLKNQGTAYAEKALEVVRGNYQTAGGYSWLKLKAPSTKAYTDGSLGTVYSPPNPICVPSDCSGSTIPWTDIAGTSYNSCVVVNIPVSQQIKVQSLVAWPDQGKCKYTEVDTYFTDY